VFQRYSERARQIVVLAQEEARALGHPFIGAEHLLLGAVRVGAAGELAIDDVRGAVAAALGPTAVRVSGGIPFRPAAQAALERASRIAGDREVLPAHVLLALLEDEAVAAIVEGGGTPARELSAELDRQAADPIADVRSPFAVTIDDERLGDLGHPRTDLAMLRAILRRDGRVADWLRTSGVDEAWLREFGG
jgi:ATP-dependent Clp protease ATP-binding subunit ClpA